MRDEANTLANLLPLAGKHGLQQGLSHILLSGLSSKGSNAVGSKCNAQQEEKACVFLLQVWTLDHFPVWKTLRDHICYEI